MSGSKLGGTIGLVAVFCAWAYIALRGEPRFPNAFANGTYFNRCCGSVVLNNGTMTVANQRIGYVIEQDKGRPYVLPNVYVGASDKGFVIKPGAYAMKLRLDNPAQPRKLELLDTGPTGEVYPFVRVGRS